MAPSFKANDKRFLDRGSSAVDRAGADLEDSAIKESVGILSADVTNYLSLLSHVSTLFPFCIQSITNFVVLLLLFTDHNHLTCITCGISSPITESNHAIPMPRCRLSKRPLSLPATKSSAWTIRCCQRRGNPRQPPRPHLPMHSLPLYVFYDAEFAHFRRRR